MTEPTPLDRFNRYHELRRRANGIGLQLIPSFSTPPPDGTRMWLSESLEPIPPVHRKSATGKPVYSLDALEELIEEQERTRSGAPTAA